SVQFRFFITLHQITTATHEATAATHEVQHKQIHQHHLQSAASANASTPPTESPPIESSRVDVTRDTKRQIKFSSVLTG
uniref:Uncharacterized protein n=1 Tax=Anopheles dirus TaxID=7168 RepID=A0A182NX48_9DIPT